MRLPAPSGFFAYGANMLSEVVLDLNDLTKPHQRHLTAKNMNPYLQYSMPYGSTGTVEYKGAVR